MTYQIRDLVTTTPVNSGDIDGLVAPVVAVAVADAVGVVEAAGVAATTAAATATAAAATATAPTNTMVDTRVRVAGGRSQAAGSLRVSPASITIPAVTGRTYAAFPSVTKTLTGVYVAVYRAATDHFNGGRIAIIRSSDEGRTWTAPTLLTVTQSVAGATDAKDPSITTLSNGHMILAWTDNGPKRAYTSKSTDLGVTWGAPVEMPTPWSRLCFISSPIVQLPSGDLVATYYGDSTGHQQAAVVRSTDLGVTWGTPVIIASATDKSFTEPNIISTGGTNLFALIRVDNAPGDNYTYKSASTNGGVTWSTPVPAFLGDGNPHMVRMRDGLLVTFPRGLESWTAQSAGWGRPGEIRVSRDNGTTWTAATPLGGAASLMTYACAIETSRDGELLCLWGADHTSTTDGRIMVCYLSANGGVSPLGPIPAPTAPRVGPSQKGLILRKSAEQPITTATYTPIVWDTVARDNLGAFTDSDPSGFAVNETGYYLLKMKVQFTSEGQIAIALTNGTNASDMLAHADTYGNAVTVWDCSPVWLTAGVVYRVQARSIAASPVIRYGNERFRTHMELVKLEGQVAF